MPSGQVGAEAAFVCAAASFFKINPSEVLSPDPLPIDEMEDVSEEAPSGEMATTTVKAFTYVFWFWRWYALDALIQAGHEIRRFRPCVPWLAETR